MDVGDGIGGSYPIYIFPFISHHWLGSLRVPERTWGKIGGFLTCDQECYRLTGERPYMVVIRTETSVGPSVGCGHRAHRELRLHIPISALWVAGSPLLEQKECACRSL